MLSDQPTQEVDEDTVKAVRPQWPAMVDTVVAVARQSFGDALADEFASVLLRRTAEANRALDESFAGAERRLDDATSAIAAIEERLMGLVADAEARQQHAAALHDEAVTDRDIAATVRQEAAELHHRASGADAAAQAAMARVQVERARLLSQRDSLQAALDAREAELVAWEAELSRHAEQVTEAPPEPESTPVDAEPQPADNTNSDAQVRLLRSQWRTPPDTDPAVPGPTGWGRRDLSDGRTEPDSR